ncbi:MAG: Transposase Tn5 dimerization domain, partial [Phycisphaerales bacterium]|nr:Transposase Tn5 dimerization domain [Phycisphaerales bacterium]MDB5333348.1 Transposase Tn5 dimerization domain [Phycisphaerales bacterium]
HPWWRKGDGDPGWITLWRGWRKLLLLIDGYELRMV